MSINQRVTRREEAENRVVLWVQHLQQFSSSYPWISVPDELRSGVNFIQQQLLPEAFPRLMSSSTPGQEEISSIRSFVSTSSVNRNEFPTVITFGKSRLSLFPFEMKSVRETISTKICFVSDSTVALTSLGINANTNQPTNFFLKFLNFNEIVEPAMPPATPGASGSSRSTVKSTSLSKLAIKSKVQPVPKQFGVWREGYVWTPKSNDRLLVRAMRLLPNGRFLISFANDVMSWDLVHEGNLVTLASPKHFTGFSHFAQDLGSRFLLTYPNRDVMPEGGRDHLSFLPEFNPSKLCSVVCNTDTEEVKVLATHSGEHITVGQRDACFSPCNTYAYDGNGQQMKVLLIQKTVPEDVGAELCPSMVEEGDGQVVFMNIVNGGENLIIAVTSHLLVYRTQPFQKLTVLPTETKWIAGFDTGNGNVLLITQGIHSTSGPHRPGRALIFSITSHRLRSTIDLLGPVFAADFHRNVLVTVESDVHGSLQVVRYQDLLG